MQNYLKEEMGLEQLGYIVRDFFYEKEVIHILMTNGLRFTLLFFAFFNI